MSDPPHNPPRVRPLFDEAEPEPNQESRPGRSIRTWLIPLGVVVALAIVSLTPYALQSRRRYAERESMVRAAVLKYAEVYGESPGHVYKYRTITPRKRHGGDWDVSITRVTVPDTLAGYGLTARIHVGRDGKAEFLGQTEGRLDGTPPYRPLPSR